MDPVDLHLLEKLENGLPFVPAPFDEIGRQLGITGDEVTERIRNLKEAGVIRKVRARIDQRKLGISANALVAWKTPGSLDGKAGFLLASFPCVTHCYERLPVPGRWEYTLYTVHHGCSRDAVLDEVRMIAHKAGVSEYAVLFSTEEFKRVPNVRIQATGGQRA